MSKAAVESIAVVTAAQANLCVGFCLDIQINKQVSVTAASSPYVVIVTLNHFDSRTPVEL